MISPPALVAAYKIMKRNVIRREARERYAHDPVAWIQERAKGHLYSKMQEIAQSVHDNRRTVVMSCHESGKALDLDTPIPTPNGWTLMRDIQEGDKVYDEQGSIVRVIGVSDTEQRECYELIFSDGSTIVAADNHLWNVLDLYKGNKASLVSDWRNKWDIAVTKTTEELKKDLCSPRGQLRWKIPSTRPLVGVQDWQLDLEPYIYGCWLGDGTTTRLELTTHTEDMDHFVNETNGHISYVYTETLAVKIALPKTKSKSIVLSQGKNIPISVLRSSYENRLSVLQGIMDTDGATEHSASVRLELTNKILFDSITELISTLGWIPRISIKEFSYRNTVYRVTFTPDVNPFKLSRKAKLWRYYKTIGNRTQRATQRTIKEVRAVGVREVKCIEVDSPRNLYLAGRSFIPTHNSWLAARIAMWWLDSSLPGEAFVVTTAPTAKQVKAVLWKEIRRVWTIANMPGRVNQTEYWTNGEMVAMGRKPDDDSPTAFQGIHARKVLLVLDEADGIPEALYVAGNSLVANEFGRIFAIGNPDNPDSHMAKICSDRSLGWNVIRISAFDTPNFTGEAVPQAVKDVLVSKIYVEEMRRDVGEDSAVYKSKVLGEYPINKLDGVILYSWLKQCQNDDDVESYSYEQVTPIELGMDVGAGGDETSIRERRGMFAGRMWEAKTPEPEQAFLIAVEAIITTGATRMKIDEIGIGWALIGMLRATALRGLHYNELTECEIDISGCSFVGINVGRAATEPEKFPRLRDQMWWEVGRELSRTKGWNLSLVDDLTISQLTDPTWGRDLSGRHKVESKQDTMKRTKKPSPNRADALLIAFTEPPAGDEYYTIVQEQQPEVVGPSY